MHRIGRTARAGAGGLAVSFCNDEERAYLRDIERLTRQKVPVAGFPEGFAPPTRQEAAETAAAEARRPPRQPQGRPGQRQGQRQGPLNGRPAGAHPGGRHRRPDRQETRGEPGRAAGQEHHGQGPRQDRRGEPRPQQGRRPRPVSGEGRAIGWLERAPRP